MISATLLGAPINTGSALDDAITSRNAALKTAVDRLYTLPAHEALVLLKSSLSTPKVMHILRCSPCHRHPSLQEFDNIMREGLGRITNSRLSDLQWTQATLPVKEGGLGLRRASQLALPAFLASAAGTAELQSFILGNGVQDTTFVEASSNWSQFHGLQAPPAASSHLQGVWDAPNIAKDKATILAAATSDHDKARLLAVTGRRGSEWLHALPITSCGLRLDDEAVRVAIGLRLGLELCQAHLCPCGSQVDCLGTHGLSCRQSAGRATWHQQLNDLIYRAVRRADVPAVKEPAGLSRSDGKRPDGLTLVPWQAGRSLTWDVTVVDTLASSYSAISTTSSGAVAEAAANRKTAKYTSVANTHIFVPIAVETLGPVCSEAESFLTDLGRRLSQHSDDPRETTYLFQRLSVLIQRFNSICFRGSFIEEAINDG